MTYFLLQGDTYQVAPDAAVNLTNMLPGGTYTVTYDELHDVYALKVIDSFEIPSKIYGDTMQTAKRILNTFYSRDSSTGVLLAGEQGSGKTLLAKILSFEGIERGVPTILVDRPYCGTTFNTFLQSIDQPTIVLFDEFEKVYHETEDQEAILTVLDGVYSSKKLFIITCNDTWRINEHMKNRPGRLFYRLDYTGLDQDFIREYCEDTLLDKSHIDTIGRITLLFSDFNFDMLKGLVEDMNRYDESPQQVLKYLNAKPENSDGAMYDVELTVNGTPVPKDKLYAPLWEGNPLNSGGFTVVYKVSAKSRRRGQPLPQALDDLIVADDDSERNEYARFSATTDLVNVDNESGKFFFQNAKGDRVSLVKSATKAFDWMAV